MGKKVRVIVDVTELGRLGGAATAANRTPAERQEAARNAIQARWDAYYAANPEKLKAKQQRETQKRRAARRQPNLPGLAAQGKKRAVAARKKKGGAK
jgi:hypothetical protein